MKPSPIQLLQLFFQKVSIEIDRKHLPAEVPNPLTSPFHFEGVTLKSEVGIAETEAPGPGEHVFEISFSLVIDNAANAESTTQRFSPYLMDVHVVAWVRVHEGAVALAPIRDLALVNGAALIWSAIREQVATTTSRMPMGQVLLPTVHFHDLKSGVAPTKPGTKRPAKKSAAASA